MHTRRYPEPYRGEARRKEEIGVPGQINSTFLSNLVQRSWIGLTTNFRQRDTRSSRESSRETACKEKKLGRANMAFFGTV